jgi:regulator of replication initiation timing
MISIQVPPFMSHHSMPNHYPMSDPTYFNGMPAFGKPLSHNNTNYTSSSNSDSKPKACGPGAKRRPSRAGTRSVSTLTAAQLERKRANDREAQRAIRQRTKDHIDALERQIQELTATNDTSARLMQALQRNEELEQENAILRSRLNHAEAAMAVGPSKFFLRTSWHPALASHPTAKAKTTKKKK